MVIREGSSLSRFLQALMYRRRCAQHLMRPRVIEKHRPVPLARMNVLLRVTTKTRRLCITKLGYWSQANMIHLLNDRANYTVRAISQVDCCIAFRSHLWCCTWWQKGGRHRRKPNLPEAHIHTSLSVASAFLRDPCCLSSPQISIWSGARQSLLGLRSTDQR